MICYKKKDLKKSIIITKCDLGIRCTFNNGFRYFTKSYLGFDTKAATKDFIEFLYNKLN